MPHIDDPNPTVAPYSANSGFYYVRNNQRTKNLFTSLLYAGDQIRAVHSHQETLTSLLNEHSSMYGLRVKTVSRDEEHFPSGWHYHKNKTFMKKLINGEVKPYIFHMCWTASKENKLKFFKQMGEWRVNEQCIGKPVRDILDNDMARHSTAALVHPCCLAKPVIECYYQDKPSIKPCNDSPKIDKHSRPFW